MFVAPVCVSFEIIIHRSSIFRSPPSGRFGQFLKWKRWVKGGMPEKTA